MAAGLLNKLVRAVQTFDRAIDIIFSRGFPPGVLCAIECNHIERQQPTNFPGQSLKDILNDSFLWAVPKSRVSLEKRLSKRFGHPKYNWKPHVPKTLLICRKCGHDYQPGLMCGYCYEQVKKETKSMQDAIQRELELQGVDENVVVIHKAEDEYSGFGSKQHDLVELIKQRPEWFDKNLLEPSTKESSSTKEVKNVDHRVKEVVTKD